MQTKKDMPPMVDPRGDWNANLVNRHGVRIWIDKPVWAEPTQIHKVTGRYFVKRVTTNRPMVQVYKDSTITGAECRWEAFRLEQTRNSSQSNDFNFGDDVARDSDDELASGQSHMDCEKVKDMIKNDKRYKSALKS